MGQSSQVRTPPIPGTNATKMAIFRWNYTDNGRFVPRAGPNVSQGGSPSVPGTVPVCPEHRPAKMFMFVGFVGEFPNLVVCKPACLQFFLRKRSFAALLRSFAPFCTLLRSFALLCRVVADVWKKDVWEFRAKSGSSGSCRLFLHFLRKIAVQEMSGKTPGSPRHPSSRHPRPSDCASDHV